MSAIRRLVIAVGRAGDGSGCSVDRLGDVDAIKVWEALAERAPAGWLPQDIDDPVLADVFRKHWRTAPRQPGVL